jgi:3',5'-nucleoside bisphosphate phosphatase
VTAGPRRRRHDPLAADGAGRVKPPGPSTIDLHTHTTRSDGVVAPADLVAAAFEVGVRLLALTDHDNLAGYREVVAARAVPSGMTLVPGVEINAIVTRDLGLWEGELHILGFGMDPADATFEATLAAQRGRRRERFERTVELLRELDLSIDGELGGLPGSDDDALGRPTVARALIAAGHAASVDDAFRRLLAWGKPGYVPRTGLGPVEAIEAIRDAGGLPVLAHFGEAMGRMDVLRELHEAGLGGLEVYYRSFDTATVRAVREVARGLGLVPTGGSDYHGDTGSYAEAHAGLWVPPEVAAGIPGAGAAYPPVTSSTRQSQVPEIPR